MSQIQSTGSGGGGGGNVNGPGSSTVGDLAIWNNTHGTLLADLATGTNGTILYSNSGTPAWGHPSGSMVLLSTQNASTSATLDFTSFTNSIYCKYVFIARSIKPDTNNVTFKLLTSTNNGSTWLSTAYDWSYVNVQNSVNNNFEGNGGDSSIHLVNGVGTANQDGVGSLELSFYPAATNANTVSETMVWSAGNTDLNGNFYMYRGGGKNETTSATNAFRFLMSSGNILSGQIKLFGLVG